MLKISQKLEYAMRAMIELSMRRDSVAQIADAIEGQLYPMFCLEPTDHTCFADSRCGLQGFSGEVARAIDGVFQRTTVADLAERHERTAGPTVFTSEQLLSGLNETMP